MQDEMGKFKKQFCQRAPTTATLRRWQGLAPSMASIQTTYVSNALPQTKRVSKVNPIIYLRLG